MSKCIILNQELEYSPGAIVSKILLENKGGNCTLFAFDAAQRLSEHTVPFDALLQIIEGKATVTLDGRNHKLKEGSALIMPAGIAHAFYAETRVTMLLTMFKK